MTAPNQKETESKRIFREGHLAGAWWAVDAANEIKRAGASDPLTVLGLFIEEVLEPWRSNDASDPFAPPRPTRQPRPAPRQFAPGCPQTAPNASDGGISTSTIQPNAQRKLT